MGELRGLADGGDSFYVRLAERTPLHAEQDPLPNGQVAVIDRWGMLEHHLDELRLCQLALQVLCVPHVCMLPAVQ